jgi:hypothetical protein
MELAGRDVNSLFVQERVAAVLDDDLGQLTVKVMSTDAEAGTIGKDVNAVQDNYLPEIRHTGCEKRLLDAGRRQRQIPRSDPGWEDCIVHSCILLIINYCSCNVLAYVQLWRENMDRRIIELAIETLEKQKAAIETEISELKSSGNKKRGRAGVPAKSVGRKTRQLSAAAKRAISERMKAYWAKRKAAQGKPKKGKG